MSETAVTLSTESANLPGFVTQANELATWAQTLIISSPAEFDAVSEKLGTIKKWRKRVEDDKEELYRPVKTGLDAITAKYKPVLDTITALEKTVQGKMTTYHAAEQAKAKAAEEAERRAREEQALEDARKREAAAQEEKERLARESAEKAAELRAAGDETMAEAVEQQAAAGIEAIAAAHENATVSHFEAASTVQNVAKTQKTSGGAFTTRMVKKFRVTGLGQVPLEYLQVNEAAVRQAIAAGVATIPGIEIYEEATSSFRAA